MLSMYKIWKCERSPWMKWKGCSWFSLFACFYSIASKIHGFINYLQSWLKCRFIFRRSVVGPDVPNRLSGSVEDACPGNILWLRKKESTVLELWSFPKEIPACMYLNVPICQLKPKQHNSCRNKNCDLKCTVGCAFLHCSHDNLIFVSAAAKCYPINTFPRCFKSSAPHKTNSSILDTNQQTMNLNFSFLLLGHL